MKKIKLGSVVNHDGVDYVYTSKGWFDKTSGSYTKTPELGVALDKIAIGNGLYEGYDSGSKGSKAGSLGGDLKTDKDILSKSSAIDKNDNLSGISKGLGSLLSDLENDKQIAIKSNDIDKKEKIENFTNKISGVLNDLNTDKDIVSKSNSIDKSAKMEGITMKLGSLLSDLKADKDIVNTSKSVERKDAIDTLTQKTGSLLSDLKRNKDIITGSIGVNGSDAGSLVDSKKSLSDNTKKSVETSASKESGSVKDNVDLPTDKIGLSNTDSLLSNNADAPTLKGTTNNPKTGEKGNLDIGAWLETGGDLSRLLLGLKGANEKVPEYEIPKEFTDYKNKLRDLSDTGLTPSELSMMKRGAEDAYSYDVNAIKSIAGGNGGVALGNLGGATSRLANNLMNIGVTDVNMRRQNLGAYGNALGTDINLGQNIFNNKYNTAMMNKQSGAQLASDAISDLNNRAQYNKAYGKNSVFAQYQGSMLKNIQDQNALLQMQLQNGGVGNSDYIQGISPYELSNQLGVPYYFNQK